MLIDRIPGHRVEQHKPTPRVIVSAETWRVLTAELAAGRTTLFGLWGDAGQVHMALLEQGEIVVVTIECRDGKFPSVGQVHPPAIRLERAIQDLYGLESLDLRDRRPWLDHDRFGVKHPLGAHVEASPVSTPYQFLPSEGESLHQIAVGPVHAGIIEPGHFRFTVNGETVVRLEQRLGYVHKGIESLMAGTSIEKA
ncbi:MAG: hydrogenase expression protein HypE, partial [Alphaproteobacteria bacterium]